MFIEYFLYLGMGYIEVNKIVIVLDFMEFVN